MRRQKQHRKTQIGYFLEFQAWIYNSDNTSYWPQPTSGLGMTTCLVPVHCRELQMAQMKYFAESAGYPPSAHVNAHWCLKLTAGWLKQGCKWPQRQRMSMAEGAGGIPRVKSQISTSLAAVSNIKHPSRGKKRKTKFKNYIGIMILHSGFRSIIFPIVLSTFSLSLQRRISQKLHKRFFFSINLCFKQGSSPPWV